VTEPGVLGSIFPVRGGRGALFAGKLLRDVSSVFTRSIKQAGLGVVEPGEPDEIQSGIIGHAALLYGKPIAIQARLRSQHRGRTSRSRGSSGQDSFGIGNSVRPC